MIPIKLTDENGIPFGVNRIGNQVSVFSKPYNVQIVENEIPGHKHVSKFGEDPDATNSTIIIWSGSVAYNWASSAETLYLSSTSNADNQSYTVVGLDGDWKEKEVTVKCTGFAGVQLPGSWIRTHRIVNVGSTDNAGIIYVSTDSDTAADGIPNPLTTVRAQLEIGMNQSQMTLWSVPAGYTAYVTGCYASAAALTARTVDIGLWVRPYGGVFQIKKTFSINSGQTSRVTYDFPLRVEQKSDIKMTANASGAAAVSAGFDAWYEV